MTRSNPARIHLAMSSLRRWMGVAAMLAGAGLGGVVAHATPTSDALVQRGQQALDRKDYDGARRLFEQAIVADPNDARAFGDLGIAHQRLGAVDKAWRYYRHALEIEPNNVWLLAWSGDLDVTIGRIESARRKLDQVGQICGRCADYQRLDRAINSDAARQAKAAAKE